MNEEKDPVEEINNAILAEFGKKGFEPPSTIQLVLIKFRAECLKDVQVLIELFGIRLLNWDFISDKQWPDVVATFAFREMTLEQFRNICSENDDTHVIRQTAAYAQNYTGVRDYSL